MSTPQHPPIETVAIVGAGAMGAMYADHFSRAGLRTLLIADAARAARLRAHPLSVNGRPLDVEVVDPIADAGTNDLPPVGLVIVAVKHAQLPMSIELLRPLVSAPTTILSVLNGLDSEALIVRGLSGADAAHPEPVPGFTAEQVPLCIALSMSTARVGDAVSYTQSGRLVFGHDEPSDAASARITAVREVLDRAGLAWGESADMRHDMWWKFMVNVSTNQPAAVLRAPYGAFVPAGPAREIMTALIDEVRAVAAAEGVRLTDHDVERWHTVLAGQPADGMTSTHQDVLAGRRTEVDIFGGRVVELGRVHGIAVPVNQTMLRLISALTDAATARG